MKVGHNIRDERVEREGGREREREHKVYTGTKYKYNKPIETTIKDLLEI